jgi:predicted phosphodiesterase
LKGLFLDQMWIHNTRFLFLAAVLALLLHFCSPDNEIAYEEVILPAGNEYIEPVPLTQDDSDQILTNYSQFPDSVKQKIDQLLPGGDVIRINHWGPFRYTVMKRYPDGHLNQVYVYLNGRIRQVYYIEKDYMERPRQFFVSGNEKTIPLSKVPEIIFTNVKRFSDTKDILRAWFVEEDMYATYVLEILQYQDNDTTAFAFRPDGILKTMGNARSMRQGVTRKWTKPEIEELLGKYRNKYSVDTVISRIQAVPFDKEKGIRFIVFGDNRINFEVWKAICKSISSKEALFAIATGDLVNEGEPEQFDEYLFGVLEKYSNFNFLPVVGNHDTGYDRLAVSYLTSFGPKSLTYYFDYGNARFIILDICSRVNTLSEQLKMADEWLNNAPKEYFKFVFAHVPPGDIKKWAYHAMSGEQSRMFTELMTKHRVDHVFLGHIHAYSTATYMNVDYTVTGGAGAKLHKRYGPKGSAYHYIIVDVKPGEIKQQLVQLQKID